MSQERIQLRVEPLGDHEYLVVAGADARTAESRFRATPEILDELGARGPAAEQLVVRETAAFLTEHQPVVDLPQMVDLDDVAAAYDGYLGELRRRIAGR